MLEVKNLVKEYKSKKGAVTKALDDVSLCFPERGMVFILGKSGSGKSTLLNVCGGLDRADSGEIIIKGKSSANFSAQDFDSYRNTFVGFVFQEYNILDEFSVEDNIGLALELQNKKRDRETIDKILEDVDMKEYASRKPNTLSGGQKQRVAIARALVKEPEIIMADEPTGALDSKTGQQVFDTLKKLSQDKLVIVISHDREFAEQYGDRIIELKDGKIISDMTRDETATSERNVRFYGTDTVCVQNGQALTDKDMESIKNFLSKQKGAAVITSSREQIGAVKRDMPELEVGEFKEIAEQPVPKQYPEQKLIRSHMPLKHAIKMGAGSLKVKPVRLVFTLLLSIVAFILFGLASTVMFFDEESVTKKTLMSSSYSYLTVSKAYYETAKYYDNGELQDEYEEVKTTRYTADEYTALKNEFGGALAGIDADFKIENLTISTYAQQYYTTNIDGVVLADSSIQMLSGNLPQTEEEVAISDFMFDTFKHSKSKLTYPDGKQVTVTDYSSVIYSTEHPVVLVFNVNDADVSLKISGVYKGSEKDAQFGALRTAADEDRSSGDGNLQYDWENARGSGLYAKVVGNDALVKKVVEANASGSSIDIYKYFKTDSLVHPSVQYTKDNEHYREVASVYGMAQYGVEGEEQLQLYDLSGNTVTSLTAGTGGVPYLVIAKSMNSLADEYLNNDPDYRSLRDQKRNEYETEYKEGHGFPEGDPNPEGSATWTQEQWDEYWNDIYDRQNLWYEDNGQAMYEYVDEQWALIDPYKDFNAHRRALVDGKLREDVAIRYMKELYDKLTDWGVTVNLDYVLAVEGADMVPFTVKGVYYGTTSDWSICMYMSDDLYNTFYLPGPSSSYYTEYETKYVEPENAYITTVFIPYENKSQDVTDKVVEMSNTRNADDSTMQITNPVMDQLEMVFDITETLATVFLWVGIALALFSFLLMFNFISASITAKKKEIGILRAIGARSADVFKIFVSEALIIAVICMAVAVAGTAVLCMVINGILMEDTMLTVAIFVFGPFSIIMIVAIALFTALLSTTIPVAVYSKKPPVESIRAL